MWAFAHPLAIIVVSAMLFCVTREDTISNKTNRPEICVFIIIWQFFSLRIVSRLSIHPVVALDVGKELKLSLGSKTGLRSRHHVVWCLPLGVLPLWFLRASHALKVKMHNKQWEYRHDPNPFTSNTKTRKTRRFFIVNRFCVGHYPDFQTR